MTDPILSQLDPKLDLWFERVVDVPVDRVWKSWTVPALLTKWFTPAPWQTVACEIDLRPGGIFRTVMRGPDGSEFPDTGCWLEIIENRKLVWTSAIGPGYRPHPSTPMPGVPFLMTAAIALESLGVQTRYTALVIHGDEAARQQHEQMGFHTGWNTALDQLVSAAKAM